MSNRAIDAVKDFSTRKGSERLLLVMIADGINKSTGVYEAKIDTLMADCNMSERWIQKLIVRLLESGELIVFERTGHSSAFAIPIFQGEQGYAPQPCDSETHLCLRMHTPLSVNREEVRRDEWSAQRRRQRSGRRVKGVNDRTPPGENDAEGDKGVNYDAPPGELSFTPPRPIVHPPVNYDAPITHSLPTDLPADVPDALTREPSSSHQKIADEPDAAPALTPPAPPLPAPGAAPTLSPQAIWGRACARMREGLPPAQMASWIIPCHLTACGWDADGDFQATLAAPGNYQARMIEDRYVYDVRQAIGGAVGVAQSRVALTIISQVAAQAAQGA